MVSAVTGQKAGVKPVQDLVGQGEFVRVAWEASRHL